MVKVTSVTFTTTSMMYIMQDNPESMLCNSINSYIRHTKEFPNILKDKTQNGKSF